MATAISLRDDFDAVVGRGGIRGASWAARALPDIAGASCQPFLHGIEQDLGHDGLMLALAGMALMEGHADINPVVEDRVESAPAHRPSSGPAAMRRCANRPNTWMHPTGTRFQSKFRCAEGAVHTWPPHSP